MSKLSNQNTKISPVACEWQDLRKELYTAEEIAESDIRVALIGQMIESRKKAGISQYELAKTSGVKQAIISRLEAGSTDPRLSTIIRLLAADGKTLQIVSLK